MELRQLRTFATAVELQSFTCAAEALGVTQSAVSQHVAALEKELRVSLFKRRGRRVTPSVHGRRFYAHIRTVLDLLDAAGQVVPQENVPVTGTLRIAACGVAAETLVPGLLGSFRKMHPEVREFVTVFDSLRATRAVETGEADVAIVGTLPESASLNAHAIACEEFVLVARPDHPLAQSKSAGAEELRKETFILREPGSSSRQCIELAFNEAGVSTAELSIGLEMNSNQAICAAVEQGLGIAFLPRAGVQRAIADGLLVIVPVQNVQPRRRLYLVTNSNSIPSTAVRAFLASFVNR